MKSIEIAGTKRQGLTKQDTKKLRTEGKVPCVLYGGKENVHFSVPAMEFKNLVYTPEVYTVKLNIEGNAYSAVMQEVQFHPVNDSLLHIDFMEVSSDKKVVMDIPVRISGTAEGMKMGGKLLVKVRRLKVRASSTDLPDSVQIDVTPLNIGQSVRVGDLKVEGVEFLDSPNNVIVGVRTTRNVVEGPEAGAAAKPAAAAPAAAKPAAAKPAAK